MPAVYRENRNSSTRQYISTAPFNGYLKAYNLTTDPNTFVQSGSLDAIAAANSTNCPKGRILRETGERLFPGQPGVSTLMVKVVDSNSCLSGYIDPNGEVFALYNWDHPASAADGTDNNDGTTAHRGPSVYTSGNILADGNLDVGGYADVSGALTVAGTADISGGLTVASGGASITGNVDVTGAIIATKPFNSTNVYSIDCAANVSLVTVTVDVSVYQNARITNVGGGGVKLQFKGSDGTAASIPKGAFCQVAISKDVGSGTPGVTFDSVSIFGGNNMSGTFTSTANSSFGYSAFAPGAGQMTTITWVRIF